MSYQLINGDCLSVMKEMVSSGKSFDHIITSPPYNRNRNDKYEFFNDKCDDYYAFLIDSSNLMLKLAKGFVFFNIMATYYNKVDVYRFMGYHANKIQQCIIWEKSNPLPASGGAITNSYEYIFVMGNNPVVSNSTYTKNHITTSVNTETSSEHKAIMNIRVSDWLIENFTKPNDSILDPFMGYGTTGVSCIRAGRNFVGIEICENYFNASKQRLDAESSCKSASGNLSNFFE